MTCIHMKNGVLVQTVENKAGKTSQDIGGRQTEWFSR